MVTINIDLWGIGWGMLCMAVAWYNCTKLRYEVHMKKMEHEYGKDS